MVDQPIVIDIRWHRDPIHGWLLVANCAAPDRTEYQDWMADDGEVNKNPEISERTDD